MLDSIFNFLVFCFIMTINCQHVKSKTEIKVARKYYECNADTNKCHLMDIRDLSKGDDFEFINGDGKKFYSSHETCLMVCNNGMLWPYPTGKTVISPEIKKLSQQKVDFEYVHATGDNLVFNTLYAAMKSDFESHIEHKKPNRHYRDHATDDTSLHITVNIQNHSSTVMQLDVDESYTLEIQYDGKSMAVHVIITSVTIFGFRHGLETLNQLIVFDSNSNYYAIASNVYIEDKPQFAYRGIMVDTSRSFISMTKLYKIVDGMSYNKLNVLHVHISDTASFPMEMTLQPNITYYGAYDEASVYTASELEEFVEYANQRGVMVLPEVDGPAHVASGFQWGKDAGVGNLIVCDNPNGDFGSEWSKSALEPATGQWNLANQYIYTLLEDMYADVSRSIGKYSNRFHIGGDEIIVGSDSTSIACYNHTVKGREILEYLEESGYSRDDSESFYQLWINYTHIVSDLVVRAYETNSTSNADNVHSIQKLHIWGGADDSDSVNGITYNLMEREDVIDILPPTRYTLQLWDESVNSITPRMIRKGYSVVLSNSDYVYLDCGNAGTFNAGGIWCQPYHEWTHIYQYVTDVAEKWNLTESDMSLILGSETLIWSEMIDSTNVEQKLWPRSAALAEALWGRNELNRHKTADWYAADPRMQQWRNVLVQRGIDAEGLQPKWCQQRGEYACTLNEGVPQ